MKWQMKEEEKSLKKESRATHSRTCQWRDSTADVFVEQFLVRRSVWNVNDAWFECRNLLNDFVFFSICSVNICQTMWSHVVRYKAKTSQNHRKNAEDLCLTKDIERLRALSLSLRLSYSRRFVSNQIKWVWRQETNVNFARFSSNSVLGSDMECCSSANRNANRMSAFFQCIHTSSLIHWPMAT